MGTRFSRAVTSRMVTSGAIGAVLPMWNPLDPVNSFLEDLATALREWYTSFLEIIVTLLTTVAVPSPEELESDFFLFALGGTYGLARILVALFATLVAVIVVLSPTVRHGAKIQATLISMLMVVLFGLLFFPLYGMLYNISKGSTEGALALLGANDIDGAVGVVIGLYDVGSVADAINTIISMGVSGTLGALIVIEAAGLHVLALFVWIFYPLGIAVRPLGQFGNAVFNAFNAALITTLIAPPVMAFAFLLPAYAQEYMSPVAMVASPFFAIVGCLLAMATPVILFFFAFKRSSEVFGRIDDASGKFDIGQMPPVSVDEVSNDIRVTNNSANSAVVADVIGDSLLYGNGKGDLFDDITTKAVNAAASAATAAGHPYVGLAVKGAGGMYRKHREAQHESDTDTSEGGEKSE